MTPDEGPPLTTDRDEWPDRRKVATFLFCAFVTTVMAMVVLLALPDRADGQGDPWAPVRDCESRGDYTIVSPDGTFHGAYQFVPSTWDSVAAIVAPEWVGALPSQAPAHVQDRMAQALAFEVPGGGLHHWPVCGRLYGSGGGPTPAAAEAPPVAPASAPAAAPTAAPTATPTLTPSPTATPVPSPTVVPSPTAPLSPSGPADRRVEPVAALDVAPMPGVEGATTSSWWSWPSFLLGTATAAATALIPRRTR